MAKININKGDRFLCRADYVMENGMIAFEAGKIYESNCDGCLLDEEDLATGNRDNGFHRMSEEEDFYDYFEPVSFTS